jgi:hypothetical protein
LAGGLERIITTVYSIKKRKNSLIIIEIMDVSARARLGHSSGFAAPPDQTAQKPTAS